MSKPALIRQGELVRLGKAANASGCVIEVEVGGRVVRLVPHTKQTPTLDQNDSDALDAAWAAYEAKHGGH